MTKIFWLALCAMTCCPVAAAPTLVVSASPLNVANYSHQLSGSPARVVLGCLRFEAQSETVEFSGFTLTLQGTGDWAGQLANRGIRVYCDSFNGGWDETDQLIARGGGSGPTVSLSTFGDLSLPEGKFYDFWIVVDLQPWNVSSGSATFKAGIASETDVQLLTPGALAALGSPAPETAELTITGVALSAPPARPSGDSCSMAAGGSGIAVALLPAMAAFARRRRD